MKTTFLLIFSILILTTQILAWSPFTLYCYRCVSNQPGCDDNLNWLWQYWGYACPEPNDKCVKITERKGANEVVTRDCLSNLYFRTDIPADRYEGCRPAAKDVRLGHYVNNSIKELDIKRNHYDDTEFCFCYFDNRCNSGTKNFITATLLIVPMFITWYYS